VGPYKILILVISVVEISSHQQQTAKYIQRAAIVADALILRHCHIDICF
jgi:hypothetical protein